MSHVLSIAGREISDRARTFVVAVVVAILPFVVAALPSARGDRATVVFYTGTTAALVLAYAMAVAFGFSTIGRDLAERRLSFYFSKPLSAASIWIGKALGSLIVIAAAFAIVAVPSIVASGGRASSPLVTGMGMLTAFVAILTIFLASHALSTFVRSRSALIAADLAGLVVCAAIVFLMLRRLILSGAMDLARVFGLAIGALFLVLLAASPVWQLERGRIDPRRSHRAYSAFFWSGAAIAVIGCAIAFAWVVLVSPAAIRAFDVQQAPGGGAVYVFGRPPHRLDYLASFLVRRDGSAQRLGATPWGGLEFSRDGRAVAWLQPFDARLTPQGEMELCVERLDVKGAKPRATGMRVNSTSRFAISGGGERIAIADRGSVSVYDLDSLHLVAAAAPPIASTSDVWMFFETPQRLRMIIAHPDEAAALYQLDLASKRLAKTGEIECTDRSWGYFSISDDGTRLAASGSEAVVDGVTGRSLFTVPQGSRLSRSVLADGSVVACRPISGAMSVDTYDRNGALVSHLLLPRVRRAYVSGEVAPRKVVLVTSEKQIPSSDGKDRTTLIVDLARGAVERTLAGFRGPLPRFWDDPRMTQFRGPELAGIDAQGHVVLADWRTGKTRGLIE